MPKPTDRSQPDAQDITHRSKAIELFTDRQGAIEAFTRHVGMTRDAVEGGAVLPILHFYGVGGCGKSLLLEKLSRMAAEMTPPLPFALVDFQQETQRSMIHALVGLKCSLERNHHISFPEFDLIWAVLVEQQGGVEAGLVRQFTPATDMALAFVEAVGAAPSSALREGAASFLAALRGKYPKVEEWVRKAGGTQRVLELRTYPTERLLSELLRAFAVELAQNAPARGDLACRAVLFLDTYEKLWENTDGPTSPQGREKDRWVRELHGELLNDNAVLLVIAGRDILCWPDIDDGWREDRDRGDLCKYLDAHLLGGLSAEDTQRYLSRCGVGRPPEGGAPEPLQAAIIECSSGGDLERNGCLPFYVGLCANIVRNQRGPDGRGVDPPPEWFQGIPNGEVAARLAARLLTSLPSLDDEYLVQALSVPRWFDHALLRDRLGSEDSARAAWERLEDYSFTEMAGDGRLRFHAIMRQALQHMLEHETPERLQELHESVHAHWQARHEAGETDAEVEAWYHHLHQAPEVAFAAWSAQAKAARDSRNGARGRALVAWLVGLDIAGPAWRERMGDKEWAGTLQNLGYWLHELRPFCLTHAEVCLQAISCHEAALTVYTEHGYPSEWAGTQNNLGNAYRDLPTGDRGENLSRAIGCYESALRVSTEAGYPSQWAMTQNNLGNAYSDLPTGDRGENLSRAIGCYESALRAYTEAGYPSEWAMTQNNLGNAYSDLPTGDRGENLSRAIGRYESALRVYTEAGYPSQWAMTQNNLGNAYSNLPTGDRGENLSRAIGRYESALRVYAEAGYPSDWAGTQSNLGIAYSYLPTGDRGENLSRAIRCYESALRVYTEAGYPSQWSITQNNLGNAYSDLPTGDRGENLSRAIGCYESALRVRTEAGYPSDWAGTQNNLGNAYSKLPTGDRGENLSRAIGCYESALRVYTEAGYPSDWAGTQNNLGGAYYGLPTGDRGENLSRAIRCYESALRVYTEAGYPSDWAMTQHNGIAYYGLPTGDRGENLSRAIGCYESALRVYTEAGYPSQWAMTRYNLALAYRAAGEYDAGCGTLEGVVGTQPGNSHAIYLLACMHALVGRAQEALEYLARAIALDGPHYRKLAREHEDFASLRDDPRFQALIVDGPEGANPDAG